MNQSWQGAPHWPRLEPVDNGTSKSVSASIHTRINPFGHNNGSSVDSTFSDYRRGDGSCQDSFELVLLALTLPLWTFITFYLIVILIHYLRSLQYYTIYDKCTSRNAHFRYDFHIMCGKHSLNYNRNEYIILDLLDNYTISSTTIQVPGSTVFNEHQMFMYRHSRSNLRCIQFSVYRRHPIRDVKSIRIAHSCSNPESRIYVYGVHIYDNTNTESKFFPIMSAIKYRGTQWALATTFEPKNENSFKKLGADCHDPFGLTNWPTYLELLTILLYIWCSSFCFGHLISVRGIAGSVPLHALTIMFIVASSSIVVSAIYLRFIKNRLATGHYESIWWYVGQQFYLLAVIGVSVGFWRLALNQKKECRRDSYDWLISTACASIILTILLIISWLVACCRRAAGDLLSQNETDVNMAKTNSKEGISFVNDPVQNMCASLRTIQESSQSRRANEQARLATAKATAVTSAAAAAAAFAKTASKSVERKKTVVPTKQISKAIPRTVQEQQQPPPPPPPQQQQQQQPPQTIAQKEAKKEDSETLDTALNTGSKHMKVRNRNSISQYV